MFDERDVKWIKDLSCLKKCGMSIQEMKDYVNLCLQGEVSIPIRKEMLKQSIQKLEDSVAYIDWKQNFYDDVFIRKASIYQ